ncbi:hypothetical protein HDV05_005448 [Chytridiales sp. JEL 0842]|nr:hypothetical protein HDV05_005448 [Chytridiales sp. JEL 0842]
MQSVHQTHLQHQQPIRNFTAPDTYYSNVTVQFTPGGNNSNQQSGSAGQSTAAGGPGFSGPIASGPPSASAGPAAPTYYQVPPTGINNYVSIPPRTNTAGGIVIPPRTKVATQAGSSGQGGSSGMYGRNYSPTAQSSGSRPASMVSVASFESIVGQVGTQTQQQQQTSQPSSSTASNPPPPSSANRPAIAIPDRSPSSQRRSVSELLDAGSALFAPPHQNYSEAFIKFDQAHEQALSEGDFYNQARALSNMGCALRCMSLFERALVFQKQAWLMTLRYVEERYDADPTSTWLSLVLRTLDLDDADTLAAAVLAADFELADLSGGKELPRTDYGNNNEVGSSSMGGGEGEYHSGNNSSRNLHRSNSMRSAKSASSRSVSGQDVTYGPPIVVWLLQLTSNLGNAHFCVGDITEAISWHAKCLQLAENVMEEYPLPTSFHLSPSEISGKSTKGLTVYGQPAPSKKNEKIKLSFMHMQTLLAQSRSLTSLGVICQHLGLDDNSLHCHTHAAAILNYYGSKSTSFGDNNITANNPSGSSKESTSNVTSPIRTTAPGLPSHQPTQSSSTPPPPSVASWRSSQITVYQAAIFANLASSYYAKGRLPSAIERLEKSTRLYGAVQDAVGAARSGSSINALKVEIGRVQGSLHWIRNMESQAVGNGEVNECMRYWGPPRLMGLNGNSGEWDESASISAGSGWVLEGIQGMLNCLAVLKEKDDLLGVLGCLLNIELTAIAKNPTYALKTTKGSPDLSAPRTTIHPFYYSHTYYILCQAYFLLTRLQNHPEQELYPAFFGTDFGDSKGPSMPFFDAEPINALLAALGTDIPAGHPELELFVVFCVGALESVIELRKQVQSSPSYAVLYTYVGGTPTVGDDKPDGDGLTLLRPPGRQGRGSNAGSGGGDGVTGVGFGMDMISQKIALLSALNGKADWMMAARYDRVGAETQSTIYYIQGAGKLDKASQDTIRVVAPPLLEANSPASLAAQASLAGPPGPMGSLSSSLSHDFSFLSSFFHLTSNAFSVPPSNAEAPPTYRHFPSEFSPTVTPALRASYFAVPTLFGIAADTMAFAAFIMQSKQAAAQALPNPPPQNPNGTYGIDLLRILRVPPSPHPARVHRELLSGAASTYCHVLGMCETCMRKAMGDPDAGCDMVYTGRSGNVGILNGFVIPGTNLGAGAGEKEGVEQKGFKFPCEHFLWR